VKWLPVFEIKRALWPEGPPRVRDVIAAQLTAPPRPQPDGATPDQQSTTVQLLLLLR